MDRPLIYANEQVQDVDLLAASKYAMVGLGHLINAVLGSGTALGGLGCTPTTPASMSVIVGAGSIYSLQNTDATAYGSLGADTAHQVMKQGTNLDTTTFALTAPSTTGYSVVHLIQAAYGDSDTGATAVPFRDSTTGEVYTQTVNTVRKGVCVLAVKTGVAATTGTQATPTPDAGYTALYAITVANGQTTITSGNIARVTGAPFIDTKLRDLAPLLSPAFTGTPTAPTPASGDNSIRVATTAWSQGNFAAKGVNADISSLTAIGNIQSLAAAAQIILRNNTLANFVNLAGTAQIPVAAGVATNFNQLIQLGQMTSTLSGNYFVIKIPTWNGTSLVNYLIQGGIIGPIGAGSSALVTLPSGYTTAARWEGSTPAVDLDGIMSVSTSVSLIGVNPLTQLIVRNHGSTSYNILWLSIGN